MDIKKKIKNGTLLALMRCNKLFKDEQYIKLLFRLRVGRKLNLSNPRRFNEKIQWLKLYYHRDEYSYIVDKVTAKEYAKALIGEKYIIPTLGVWDSPDEIDFDSLPDQFVLKTTDGGGAAGVIVVKDKSRIKQDEVVNALNKALKQDIYGNLREYPYKLIKKRILAEVCLIDEINSIGGDLSDYKFYCFNGVVKYCEVIAGRHSIKQIDFYDTEWNRTEFNFRNRKSSLEPLPKPTDFEEMLDIATKLSADKPFSRIDLYNVNGKIYFGEVTFYPGTGCSVFVPDEWNERLGDMLQLPEKSI